MPRADGPVEKVEYIVVRNPRRAGEQLEVEFTPDHRGQGEHALGIPSQAHDAPANDLTNAVRQGCVF